ncbi:FHA domain-containing protein [Rhizobium ruizarguesonis]
MLSRVAERKMLSVRGFLLFAWIILIISLFWDPYSVVLTRAENVLSPFRITDDAVVVQDQTIVATPYALGNRIFWTMAVPILPLFLMVFGHEAWRRICPLSLASQIPGYIGLRRYRSRLERRTGLLTRKVPLISPTGWFARHSWYVQFGMLFAGVSTRLLIINSDRQALGIALISVICAAMLTGFLWGGKTWCNYFCPANIVQKIYTEPGGIFESAPHFSRPALPQSMCRKPSPKGDVSACVACTANCGDIDLQRAYWNGILDPQRRNVYYLFFGLILGFYGYYYIYSGNWDYYFSGIWTHEDGTAHKLLRPGIYVLGQLFNVPKIVAAPLVLALFSAFGLACGHALEALYRWFVKKADMPEKVIVHHCLAIAAWASINAFYLFGGRPNILLLPFLGGRLLDIVIVTLTTVWLRRALQHGPIRYQQESMASGLLGELRKLKVNVSKFLDGRKLESLRADEIYLLTKALPGFSQQQKLEAYRNILDEAVSTGTTASSSSMKLLRDFRIQMNISEEEHGTLLEELGLAHIDSANDAAMTQEEKMESLSHYRSILSSAVASRMDGGMAISDIFADAGFRSTIDVMRQSLQISDAEHETIFAELSSQSGIVSAKMSEVLEALVRQKSIRLCMEAAVISDPLARALLELLHDAMDSHEQAIRIEALSVLRNFAPEPQSQRYAEDLASLCGRDLDLILRQAVPSRPTVRWRDILHPAILTILLGGAASADLEEGLVGERRTHRKAILGSLDIQSNLLQMLAFDDPLIRAIGLMVFGYIDADLTRDAARQMLEDPSDADHPMLVAVVKYMAGASDTVIDSARGIVLRAVVRIAGQPHRVMDLVGNQITIGRAPDNDIVVAHPSAWTYHVALKMVQGEMRLMRLDEGGVFVNGKQLLQESVTLKKNSVITLGTPAAGEPEVEIGWQDEIDTGTRLAVHPALRLAMLAGNGHLARLPLASLADIAFQSTVGRYVRGASLQAASAQEFHLLIYNGQVRLFDRARTEFGIHADFGPGDLIGAELAEQGSSVVPQVTSDYAIVMQVPSTPDVSAAALRDIPKAVKRMAVPGKAAEEARATTEQRSRSQSMESRANQTQA